MNCFNLPIGCKRHNLLLLIAMLAMLWQPVFAQVPDRLTGNIGGGSRHTAQGFAASPGPGPV